MNQVVTLVILYDDGTYHVMLDSDKECSKRFKGKKYRVVFGVIGDYKNLIKHFGVKKFMLLMDAYSPDFDAMIQTLGV